MGGAKEFHGACCARIEVLYFLVAYSSPETKLIISIKRQLGDVECQHVYRNACCINC